MNAWNEGGGGGGDPHWANSNLGGMILQHIGMLQRIYGSNQGFIQAYI